MLRLLWMIVLFPPPSPLPLPLIFFFFLFFVRGEREEGDNETKLTPNPNPVFHPDWYGITGYKTQGTNNVPGALRTANLATRYGVYALEELVRFSLPFSLLAPPFPPPHLPPNHQTTNLILSIVNNPTHPPHGLLRATLRALPAHPTPRLHIP